MRLPMTRRELVRQINLCNNAEFLHVLDVGGETVLVVRATRFAAEWISRELPLDLEEVRNGVYFCRRRTIFSRKRAVA